MFPQGKVGAIGPTIVDDAHRRKGYAAQLIRENIAYAQSLPQEKRPTSLYLAASDMGRPVYAKIGFEAVTTVTSYGHELKPTEETLKMKPQEHLTQSGMGADLSIEMGGETISIDDWSQISTLCQIASGLEDRRKALEMVSLAYPRASLGSKGVTLQVGTKHCFIRQGSQIVAVVLARLQRNGYEIGPIIASDRHQARALLSSVFLDIYHSKQADSTAGKEVDGQPWGKVDVSIDEATDADGELSRYFTEKWGLGSYMKQPLMEYLLDRDAAERGDKGPMGKRVELAKRGALEAPLQFAVINLAVM